MGRWFLVSLTARARARPCVCVPQGCIGREGASEAAPAAVRQAVGGGCRSGWGVLSFAVAVWSCCRLQMPWSLALAIGGGQWLGVGWAPWRGGGGAQGCIGREETPEAAPEAGR